MDALMEMRIVAVKAKPAFKPLLEIITLKPQSGIALIVSSQNLALMRATPLFRVSGGDGGELTSLANTLFR